MLRFLSSVILFCCAVLGSFFPAEAAKRVALVIGNSAYKHAEALKNPRNDAEAIAAKLAGLGFDVVKGIDLEHVDFAQSVAIFRKKLRGADVGLFFYAGHGLQAHGKNYLVPIDAKLDDETALAFEAVSLSVLLRLMERETNTNLVFLDACRDNPLARNLARSMGTRSNALGRGLARVESGLGTLISFATQPGNVALDGEGDNSPFAAGMLKHISTPGLDVELAMRRVREDVIKATSGAQVPWSNSSLIGSFVFKSSPNDKGEGRSKESELDLSRRNDEPVAVELTFWEAAKESNTSQSYKAYLKKYPDGNFALLAEIKLQEIAEEKEAEIKRHEELRDAQEKKAAAEKARREAEVTQRTEQDGGAREESKVKLAKLRTDVERRQKEFEALKRKHDEERKALATERDTLAKQLKEMEDAAKKRAEENQEKELKIAAVQPDTPSTISGPELVNAVQRELERAGCDPGPVDGVWGRKGRAALSRFMDHTGLAFPVNEPTHDMLVQIRRVKERVCPETKKTRTKTVDRKSVKITKKNTQTLQNKNSLNSERGQFMRPGQIGQGKAWKDMNDYCTTFPRSINCWGRY